MKRVELARQIGMGEGTFSQKFRIDGRGAWKQEDIAKIAEYFDVTPEWLTGKVPMEPILTASDDGRDSAVDAESHNEKDRSETPDTNGQRFVDAATVLKVLESPEGAALVADAIQRGAAQLTNEERQETSKGPDHSWPAGPSVVVVTDARLEPAHEGMVRPPGLEPGTQ